jgi:hypothetical protein
MSENEGFHYDGWLAAAAIRQDGVGFHFWFIVMWIFESDLFDLK